MRGAQHERRPPRPSLGLTPALTGKTGRRRFVTAPTWAHPRGTRGSEGSFRAPRQRARPTPAHAETATPSPGAHPSDQDNPRTHRERTSISRNSTLESEQPPRTRRTPHRRSPIPRRGGLTPAYTRRTEPAPKHPLQPGITPAHAGNARTGETTFPATAPHQRDAQEALLSRHREEKPSGLLT